MCSESIFLRIFVTWHVTGSETVNGDKNGKYMFNVHWPNCAGLIEDFCTVCEQPWVDLNPRPFALKATTLTTQLSVIKTVVNIRIFSFLDGHGGKTIADVGSG